MFTQSAMERLRYAVRETERERLRNDAYSSYPQWPQYLQFPPIVTVRITGNIDPITGTYPAVITDAPTNYTWEDGGSIRAKPANPNDIFTPGRRYPARPSHPHDFEGTGTDITFTKDVYIAYSIGSGSPFIIGSGTYPGTGSGSWLGTGTVPWINIEQSIITIEQTQTYINQSHTDAHNIQESITQLTQLINTATQTFNIVNQTYNNSSIVFNTTNLTFNNGNLILNPGLVVQFNLDQPAQVLQNLRLNLANNVNMIVNGGVPGANNLLQINVPLQLNRMLRLAQLPVPAIGVNQNPLNLGAINNADNPVFRLAVNAAGIKLQGLAPAANANPGMMLGIINAGPNNPTWENRTSSSSANYVRTPNGIDYIQSLNELLWFYADGSSNEWVMSAHSDGTGSSSGGSFSGTINYIPYFSSSTTLADGWIRQDPAGGSSQVIMESPSLGGTQLLDIIRSTASQLFLGGTIASPFAKIYASGATTLIVQAQSTGKPKIELNINTGTRETTLDLNDDGTGNVAYSVRGTKGLTGRLRPGATTKGGVIDYLGTGDYGTGTGTGGHSHGTVKTVSVASSHGLAGTVATPTTTPVITLSTTVTGVLKGDGTTISAAIADTDYATPAGVTSYVSANYQPLDADLTNIAALSGTNNIYYRSAANTWTTVTFTSPITFSAGAIAHAASGVTGTYFRKANIVVNPTGHVTFGEDGTASSTFDITGLSADDPALTNESPIYRTVATVGNKKVTLSKVGGILGMTFCGGRIGGSSSDPLAGVTAGSTLYLLPYASDRVILWDGTRFIEKQFTSVSAAVTGLTASTFYSVYIYDNSGTLTLEFSTTAPALINGIFYKTSDQTRLYLGAILVDASSKCNDLVGKRNIANFFYPLRYVDFQRDSTDSWTNTGNGVWSTMNSGNANWTFAGINAADNWGISSDATIYATTTGQIAVGLVSTGAIRGSGIWGAQPNATAAFIAASFAANPARGAYTVQAYQTTWSGTSATFFGDNGSTFGGGSTGINSGMRVIGWR